MLMKLKGLKIMITKIVNNHEKVVDNDNWMIWDNYNYSIWYLMIISKSFHRVNEVNKEYDITINKERWYNY